MPIENDVADLQRQVIAIDRQLKAYERLFDLTLGKLTIPSVIASGVYAGASATSPDANDMHFEGNLKSVKGGVTHDVYSFVPLITKLTSTSFDGDAFSTTAKTLIDLSAVFGAPPGIKAIAVNIIARDSASAAGGTARVTLGPDDVSVNGMTLYLTGETDDKLRLLNALVPCDANGDVYYQVAATGAGTLDLWIEIWGYWI